MKKVIAVAILLALVLFLIPMGIRQDRKTEGGAGETPSPAVELPESGVTLNILNNGEIVPMDLNQYLWGVVAAEMPASFEQEALKAQAVAARTYSLHKAGSAANHPEADLCTDHRCCQAWIARDAAQTNWGDKAAAYTDKISTAVAETNGEVILYEGQLISALFHSSSGDTTQDAVAVWGNSVPYLVSVPSPEGEEVPDLYTDVTLTPQEFKDTFLAAHPEAVLEGDPTAWVGQPVLTNGGSVGTIVIGGVEVTGTQVRSLFGLRSAVFTLEATPETLTFHVSGFGHGVGMSQYGANAMAAQGSDYVEILRHYYTGVTVEAAPQG